MNSIRQRGTALLSCLLVLAVLGACGTPQQPEDPGVLAPEQESSGDTTGPDPIAEIPEEEVFLDDLLYPEAEFLFEISGLGGPMMPYRFYSASGTSTDEAAEYYLDRLPWFVVQADEVQEGFRRLDLAHPDPLRGLDGVEAEDLAEAGSELDGAVLGVEVVHSTAHANAGLSRLLIAIQGQGRADDIPADTTIIILEYFSNPY